MSSSSKLRRASSRGCARWSSKRCRACFRSMSRSKSTSKSATTGPSATKSDDQRFHLTNGPLHADQHGAGHDSMADVQLVHVLDLSDGLHVVIVEPVSGVQPQAKAADELARFDQCSQLLHLGGSLGQCVLPGMQL